MGDPSHYHTNVFWSDEDGSFVADIPDLEGCSAFGETPQQALEQVLVARDLWIETARKKGMAVPEPRYRPAIYLAG